MTEVVFQGERCRVELTRYRNGRPALEIHDAFDGDLVAVASVNLSDVPADSDEVFIKDYSENEGMLAALEAAGVVRATGDRVQSGFASIPRAKLLPGFLASIRGDAEADHPRAAPAPAEGARIYQVWLNDKPPVERIKQMFGVHSPEFPNGFLHVADVAAGSVDQAYWKAHSEGNILDPHDTSWKDWQKNEGVRVLLPDKRGADFGDVIVSPDDQPHQLINGGFRNVPWVPLRESDAHVEQRSINTKSTGDAPTPSPSDIANDHRAAAPELSTGRTKGKKP